MNKTKRVIGLVIAVMVFCLLALIVRGMVKKPSQPPDATASVSLTDEQSSLSGTETTQTPSEPTTPGTQTGAPSSSAGTTAASTTRPASTTAFVPTNGYPYKYPGINPKPAVINSDKWYLILVNRSYFITEDYPVVLVPAVIGVNEGYRLDARVAPQYRAMYAAALKEGNKLTPFSGHRRFSTQKTNYENKIRLYQNQGMSYADAVLKAAESIMPPGCSEHNTGLAMDIVSIDVGFQYSGEYRWLQENAADYGFILRYPADKTHITKVKFEPWHWRYVGIEAAKAIKESGQCLEEYLGMLD